jgi:cytochrome c556
MSASEIVTSHHASHVHADQQPHEAEGVLCMLVHLQTCAASRQDSVQRGTQTGLTTAPTVWLELPAQHHAAKGEPLHDVLCVCVGQV